MRIQFWLLLIASMLIFGGCKGQEEVHEEGDGATAIEESDVTAVEDESIVEDESVVEEAYQYVDEAGREISLEKTPSRIATTYLPLWESLILLDIQPIGVSGADNYLVTWDPFQGKELGEVVDLGSKEVNLELLTELEPDLILEQAYDLSSYDIKNLEQIATVAVFGPKAKTDWRHNLREVAKVVNQTEKAEQVISEVEAKIAVAKEKIKAQYNEKTVMQMSMMAIDKLYVLYREDLYGQEDGLGLVPPAAFPTDTNYVQITMEALVEMNPDVLFVNVFDGDEGVFEELQQNPVWKNLNAVKNNQVFRLDGSGHALSALSTIYTIETIVDSLIAEE